MQQDMFKGQSPKEDFVVPSAVLNDIADCLVVTMQGVSFLAVACSDFDPDLADDLLNLRSEVAYVLNKSIATQERVVRKVVNDVQKIK